MDISQTKCSGCGHQMTISRTHCHQCNVSLEGDFEVSPLARLSLEDQMFVTAFLRHHGSIKKMESLFSISYPTVKNRLNSIAAQIDRSFDVPSSNSLVLDELAQGKITVDEAIDRLV